MDVSEQYNTSIFNKLTLLSHRIEIGGKLNLLNNHVRSENFYMHMMNRIFGWELKNLNVTHQNAQGIDLHDESRKIVIQVSSTATRSKIESALSKHQPFYKDGGYSFKFISISKDASRLRKPATPYANPHKLAFVPSQDIYDIAKLATYIEGLDIAPLTSLNKWFEQHFSSFAGVTNVETNVAAIILTLAKQSWSEISKEPETLSYDIDRKIDENNLVNTRVAVEEHAAFHNRLGKLYAEFDKHGANKSMSVLASVRRIYTGIISSKEDLTSDEVFAKVIDRVMEKVRASANYKVLPDDELELCVEILVVDAFIRCKIFKNPARILKNANS